MDLATESIIAADKKREKELANKEKKREKVKEKALQLIEEYKSQMDDDLYERTKKEINGEAKEEQEEQEEEVQEEPPKKKRGRKKKTEEQNSEETKVS